MCSFIATNKPIRCEAYVNYFARFRGPDQTTKQIHHGFTFIHNLLSITGAVTPQPFVDDTGNIVAFYNGEIYNYRALGTYQSDGECIIPLYKQYGETFTRHFDGEFAIALFDFNKGIVITSTDVFATKPLWIGSDGTAIGLASYESCLLRLGFQQVKKAAANATQIFRLSDGALLDSFPVFQFDLSQHKHTVDDFILRFEEAIHKRSQGLREKMFIGLSGGYDSGAIACELTKQGVPFRAYSIIGREDKNILMARHERLREPGVMIDLQYREYTEAKQYIKLNAEEFTFTINPHHKNQLLTGDTGAIGLSSICQRAKQEGRKVLFSGQGGDEIYSDYGNAGQKLSSHSSFGGTFPTDLTKHFPWKNFYEGAQVSYIAKDEHVAGSHGIEGRYPFLDAKLVQEFLWLDVSLKNKGYKYPIAEYLKRNDYPVSDNGKMGFVLPTFPVWQKLTPLSVYRRVTFFLKKMWQKSSNAYQSFMCTKSV